jgi:hypothetical protein
MAEAPYDTWGYHLGGYDPRPVPLRRYLCFQNEVIVGWHEDELVRFVMEKHPEASRLPASGKHTALPWDIVSVFVIDNPEAIDGVTTVAYLWRERL